MLSHIKSLPDQLEEGWIQGLKVKGTSGGSIKHIVLAGSGVSAEAAGILHAFVTPACEIPITVVKDFQFPVWVNGEDILIIVTALSDHENDKSSLAQFINGRNYNVFIICYDGPIVSMAEQRSVPVSTLPGKLSSGTSISTGFLFSLYLSIFYRLRWIYEANC
jgi:hypothetical protein